MWKCCLLDFMALSFGNTWRRCLSAILWRDHDIEKIAKRQRRPVPGVRSQLAPARMVCYNLVQAPSIVKGADVQIRIPRTHIELFVALKKRVGDQLRMRGVEPSDSAIFAEMVVILDVAVQPTPLPGTVSPDALLAAITRSLDIAGKAMNAADRLDAMFLTQFPDEYEASKAEK